MAQFNTITQAVQILSISRPTIYRKIKTGEIPAVHLGGRVLIPAVFLRN
jgi:excisionase family DNA binding protein